MLPFARKLGYVWLKFHLTDDVFFPRVVVCFNSSKAVYSYLYGICILYLSVLQLYPKTSSFSLHSHPTLFSLF